MAAAAIIAFGSCQKGSAPGASLNTDLDTLSYELGMANSRGLKMYLSERMGIDTTYLDEFFKGVVVAAQAGDDKKKAAYYAGIQIGQQIGSQMLKGVNYQIFGEDSTQSISLRNFLAGFIDATKGKGEKISMKQAEKEFQKRMEDMRDKALSKVYNENKEAGEKFLAENAKKDGVKTTPSGLQYKVIKEGNGPIPADTSKVLVHYEGRLVNDTIFDSSYKNNDGKPVQIVVGQMIPGWIETLTMMPVGSTWEVYIPQELAYGSREVGSKVKPFSALIFKLELVKIEE